MPWNIRRDNLEGRSVTLHENVTVTHEKSYVNQCMVFVAKSTIPGAGYGLFLRPIKSGKVLFFKKNTTLCIYANKLLPMSSFDSMPNTDYAIAISSSRPGIADGYIYEGYNIGLTKVDFLMQFAQDLYLNVTDLRSCEDVASKKCNACFATGSSPGSCVFKCVCRKT